MHQISWLAIKLLLIKNSANMSNGLRCSKNSVRHNMFRISLNVLTNTHCDVSIDIFL